MKIAIVELDSGHRHAYLLSDGSKIESISCYGIRGLGRCTANCQRVGAEFRQPRRLPTRYYSMSKAPEVARENLITALPVE